MGTSMENGVFRIHSVSPTVRRLYLQHPPILAPRPINLIPPHFRRLDVHLPLTDPPVHNFLPIAPHQTLPLPTINIFCPPHHPLHPLPCQNSLPATINGKPPSPNPPNRRLNTITPRVPAVASSSSSYIGPCHGPAVFRSRHPARSSMRYPPKPTRPRRTARAYSCPGMRESV